MRARYTIYSKAGYILETFCGAVTYARLEEFVSRQHQDPRILQRFHTVSDYSQATLHLSVDEVKRFAKQMCDAPAARDGKRAIVIVGSRNFGFADIFRSCLAQAAIDSHCFSHRDAALRWLSVSPQQQVPQMQVMSHS